MGISVIINTYNEEKNIANAILSVRNWVDEIIVVDMYSQDDTVRIARELGAEVFLHENMGYADPARQFAIEQATQQWILILDADEMINRKTARILQRLAQGSAIDIVSLPRHNYMFGQLIRATGWGAEQDRQLRFFRKGSLNTTGEIHHFLHPVPGQMIWEMEAAEDMGIIHFNYTTLRHFVDKLNRYTSIEAEGARRTSQTFKAILRNSPFFEFVKRYLLKQGYRDGRSGLTLSVLMAFYVYLTNVKRRERGEVGDEQDIRRYYQRVAQDILREYEQPS